MFLSRDDWDLIQRLSSGRIHYCYIILRNVEKEKKKVCPFFLHENSQRLSPWQLNGQEFEQTLGDSEGLFSSPLTPTGCLPVQLRSDTASSEHRPPRLRAQSHTAVPTSEVSCQRVARQSRGAKPARWCKGNPRSVKPQTHCLNNKWSRKALMTPETS